jgi:hypothetical protein
VASLGGLVLVAGRQAAQADDQTVRREAARIIDACNAGIGCVGGAEMMEPKAASRRWTSAEEKQLTELPDAGMTASEIAPRINRTTQAIYARLQRIYISRHPNIGG